MNLQLGNLNLEEIINPEYLQQIQDFLDNNGYQRENICSNIEKKIGNYHIFDLPRQIMICDVDKTKEFIKFLQDNDLVEKAFKERISLAGCELLNN
jgi:hypothetical protein